MASGSESAAEKVGPRWEVGPTEDVVQALMETLVDPLLPLRVSSVPPSEDVQIAVAKQMHAVVLLYNYHHRKQKPELVFIEFVNFCKLAIVIRPSLIAFMKMMKESKSQELNGNEDRLSVTEKAIKDACDIALGLDASRDVPNMEGWPTSKLAVLLIDSKKENCMLQSGAVTEGALSLIEKELNDSSIPPEISSGNKVGNKRKRDNLQLSTYNAEFLQLGYDVVKDVTGISSSELKVLETHMTYSLNKEKSAAWFYIMQCPGSFDEHKQVPLKFLVESVQGRIAEKFANGLWKTTPLVKLHHMLPYMELILSWHSGLEMEMNSSDQKASEHCYSNNKFGDSSPGRVASPVDIFQSTEEYGNFTNTFVKRFKIPDSAESSQNGVLESLADGSEQPDKGLSSSPSRGLCEMMVNVDETMEEFEKGCNIADHIKEVARRVILEVLEKADAESDDPVTGHSRRLFGKTLIDDRVREKFDEKYDVGDSAEKDERRICLEILDKERVGCGKDVLAGPPRVLKTTNIYDLTNICMDSEDNKMPNTKIKVYYHRRKKNSSLKNVVKLQEAVPDLMVDMAGSLESNHTQRRDEKVSGDEGYLTITCNQTGTTPGDQQAQLEGKTKHSVEVQENKQAQLQAEIKHNVELQSTLESLRSDHTQSRDEILYVDKGDHTHECNHTGIAAMGNQLAQFEATFKHNLGAHNISAADQLQNALPLLYRTRRELYSQICNMEDTLALCEDNVARIRDGGDVDLARQCIKSVISGKFRSLMENETQVHDNGSNQQDENIKSQHGKPTRLSEAYLPGKSSCEDLEYTCQRNNWRLPRYLTESSDGKFISNVVVQGKDFKLDAKGGLECNPCKARESAAAKMITVMHNFFL